VINAWSLHESKVVLLPFQCLAEADDVLCSADQAALEGDAILPRVGVALHRVSIALGPVNSALAATSSMPTRASLRCASDGNKNPRNPLKYRSFNLTHSDPLRLMKNLFNITTPFLEVPFSS